MTQKHILPNVPDDADSDDLFNALMGDVAKGRAKKAAAQVEARNETLPQADLANDLRQTVETAAVRLLAVSELQAQTSSGAGHWSAQKILGHLIDSAANNHPRFVRAQATDDLVFTGYEQEYWVTVHHYDEMPWPALVQFWQMYNLLLAHVIAHIPTDTLTAPRARHTLDKIAWQTVAAGTPATLAYLIGDYIGHLKMHLQQIDAALAATGQGLGS
jgi:hypothetical protein